MKSGVRIDVLVPAHNEARHIAGVLQTMPAEVHAIWVVDDGSTDDTAAQVRACNEPRTRYLSHPTRRGVGAALTTGYSAAFADGADLVAVMAGDGQMAPPDLLPLLSPLLEGRADYAKGNRLCHPEVRRRMPPSRYLANQVFSQLTRWATGLAIHDSQCGYTALTRDGASRIPLDRLWHSYGYPNDLLGWAALGALRVAEVPVQPIYADEISGIRLHHGLWVVPSVLGRVALRRLRHRLLGSPCALGY